MEKKYIKSRKIIFSLFVLVALFFSFGVKADTYPFDGEISATKTVSDLDSNDIAHVRIDLPAAEYKPVYDIVFVIDATNPNLISALATNLTSVITAELKKNDKVTINIGAVVFGTYVTKSGNVYTQSNTTNIQMKELNTLSDAQIQQHFNSFTTAAYLRALGMQNAKNSGLLIGTNLQSGIIEGRKILDAGNAPAENKLMVMLTDGGTYMYTKDNETNTNAFVQGRTVDGGDNIINHGTLRYNDGYDLQAAAGYSVNNMAYGKYLTEANPFAAFYAQEGAQIETDSNGLAISKYYDGVNGAAALPPDYSIQDNLINITDLPNKTKYPYTGFEKGIYYAGKELKEMTDGGYKLATIGFPYYAQYTSHYVPSQGFMKWTEESLGGNYIPLANDSDASGVAKAVESIKNEIVYLFNSGTVKEKIGKDFSLVSLNTIDVKVDGVSQPKTIDSGNPNKINFGTIDPLTNKYPYVATYNETTKQIEWEINVPIQNTKPVSLHFDIKLNRSKIAGKHDGHTGDTTINYIDTYDNAGSESLKGPNIPYTVKYKAKILFLNEKNQQVELKNSLNLIADNAKYDFSKKVDLKKEIKKDGKTYVFVKYANNSLKLSGTTPTNDFEIKLLYKEKKIVVPTPDPPISGMTNYALYFAYIAGALCVVYLLRKTKVH